jgi:hypothetical protein
LTAARIPPESVDPVAKGVGDSFGFLQLDTILYRCEGEHIINEWTNEQLPRRTIARNCIDGAEKRGIIVLFLAYILDALPASSPLYALIVGVVPDAQNALPEVKKQIGDVRTGLERTRVLLSDPTARSAFASSKDTLTSLEDRISRLDGYKGLHDCLHVLQLKQISLLMASSAAIASDDVHYASLREYKDQVRSQVQSARSIVDRLPEEPSLRSVETKWIDSLEEAAKIIQKSLENRNPNTAKVGIIRMSRVLQVQPPRLNDLIVAAAKEMPLQQLSQTLGTLVATMKSPNSEIANAQVALGRLQQALRGRVVEHDIWQDIDEQIWVIEQLFDQTSDPTDAFTTAWPDLKTPLRTMSDLSPEAEWSNNIRDYSDRIDIELLRLQSLETATGQGGRPKSTLLNLFADLRSEARLRFFIVDQQLKRDCELLVGIGVPIKNILGILSND